MARFYRTSSANPIDYMYKSNVPLMEKVILANDQFIDETISGLGQLGQAATSFGYLKQDEPRTKELMDNYGSKIDSLTEAIRQDPANWRSQMNPIRQVGKELHKDFTTGDISKITGNYGKYKKVSDDIDEQVKEFGKTGKGISGDRARAYKQMFLNNYQGYQHGDISVFDPMANMDIRKTLSEELDKMKEDGEIRITDQVTGSGEYLNKETNKWEGITPERILRIVTDRLHNPQLMNYLKQDTMAGILTGVFDTDPSSANYGKFIAPYSKDPVKISSAEQAIIDNTRRTINKTTNSKTKEHLQEQLKGYIDQLGERTELNWNEDSYLAPIMRGVIDQYSNRKTSHENDLTANSIWSTKFTQGQENYRMGVNNNLKLDMQDKLFKHQDEIQQKALDARKQIELMKLRKTTTGKTGVGKTNIDNSISGTFENTPYYHQAVDPSIMTKALGDEIMTTQKRADGLQKSYNQMLQKEPNNTLMLGSVENDMLAAQTKLESLKSRQSKVIDYAITQWKNKKGITNLPGKYQRGDPTNYYSEAGEKNMREYVSGAAAEKLSAANEELKKLEVIKSRMDRTTSEYQDFLKTKYNPVAKRKADLDNNYIAGRKIFTTEIEPHSNAKLEKAAKETTNRASLVETTRDQDERLVKMFNTDPSRYEIKDAQTGQEIGLDFNQGTAATDTRGFKILGVAPSTGGDNRGIQVLAEVKGKTVIITPKDDGNVLESFISQEFAKSNDKDVRNIGRVLSSPTGGTINDMLTELRLNVGTDFNTKDAWSYRNIPSPVNSKEVSKIRIRSISTGVGEPKWEVQVETNDANAIIRNLQNETDFKVDNKKGAKGFIPLRTTDRPNGIYHNLEDIINIFPTKQ